MVVKLTNIDIKRIIWLLHPEVQCVIAVRAAFAHAVLLPGMMLVNSRFEGFFILNCLTHIIISHHIFSGKITHVQLVAWKQKQAVLFGSYQQILSISAELCVSAHVQVCFLINYFYFYFYFYF
jgi:hypothetical protein